MRRCRLTRDSWGAECLGGATIVDVHAGQISVTREVPRTVEVQHVHCIDRIANVLGTPVSGIQEVLKTVRVPKFKNVDMIRDVPAVRLRQAQVPIVKTVQKMVEAPQELLVDHEVDVPVGCDVRFRRSRKRTEQTRLHRCCAMIRPDMFQKRRRSGCSTRTEKVPNSLSNSRKERFSSSTKKGKAADCQRDQSRRFERS